MIKPTKYTNINLSIIGISADILSLLKIKNTQKYAQLFAKTIYKKGDGVKVNFLLALTFLFMLGKIKYYQKEDVVELLADN